MASEAQTTHLNQEMAMFDIVTRIAERTPRLRSAERKVAALILTDLSAAARASIGALASRAEVSIATVKRFAKAVDCRDVRELKLRLAQAAAIGQRFLNAPTALPGSLVASVYEEARATLAQNQRLLEKAPLAEAAGALLTARMMHIFGVGGISAALTDELRHQLLRLARPVGSERDAGMQRLIAATMGPNTVLVALSAGDEAPELLANCRLARERGAPLIAFTAPDSSLAGLAQWVIPVGAKDSGSEPKPSASRYAMLMALDLLVTKAGVLLQQADTPRPARQSPEAPHAGVVE